MQRRCADAGYLAGVRVNERDILFAATERRTKEEIDQLVKLIMEE